MVLKELADMAAAQNANASAIAELKTALIEPLTGEKNILVTRGIPRTPEQKLLSGASYINQYIEENPDKAELVEIVLAAAQGPKGLMMLAAQKAAGETEVGKQLANYSAEIAQSVGKTIAEAVEGKPLDSSNDHFVIGGGTPMAMLLVGTVTAGGAKLGEGGVGAKGVGSGAKFADQAKLDDHSARHGSDFGAKNTLEYQAQADKFLTASKPAGVLEKARPNGDIVRYNPSTDEFGVVSSGGSIRTYYKPDPAVHGKGSNLDYFNAQ